jgi:poly-gamma-glutamate capsule biosynthesis protein CapA/YwtB (metallophosphatase superfamily)
MKEKLWDRIQRGMDEGFDAAIATVHAITEKAGEGIELTRLRREKTRLETQVTRRLAELGNNVYEKIAADRLDDAAEQLAIKDILLEIAQDEARMVEIDKRLNRAMKDQE